MVTTAQKKITVKELFEMELEDGFYYELINGKILKKQAPTPDHQSVSGEINEIIRNFVKQNQLDKVFYSPIDVFFDNYNHTQPDILFIKKERNFIITSHGIEGVPDLIVEIISPSSIKTDRNDKFNLYLEFGVSEYWIVDPRYQSIEIHVLENGKYVLRSFATVTGIVQSKVLEGLNLEIAPIFSVMI